MEEHSKPPTPICRGNSLWESQFSWTRPSADLGEEQTNDYQKHCQLPEKRKAIPLLDTRCRSFSLLDGTKGANKRPPLFEHPSNEGGNIDGTGKSVDPT